MHFKDSELRQFSREYIDSLDTKRLPELIQKLIQDLMAARDDLNRTPANSSKPSSTREPWDRGCAGKGKGEQKEGVEGEEATVEDEEAAIKDKEYSDQSAADSQDEAVPAQEGHERADEQKQESIEPKRPGKQKGAPGFGRTQHIPVTGEIIHRPECCAGCGEPLAAGLQFKAEMAFHQLDLAVPEAGQTGLKVLNTKHTYGCIACPCGFTTHTKPHRLPKNEEWQVELTEWRLIGPRLLSLIVHLSKKSHMTLSKIADFLKTWCNLQLSEGCISRALREAGRAASAMEPALLEALRELKVLYMDETSWWEHKFTRWAWVACGEGVVYYSVGKRAREVAVRILEGFKGILVTDGYTVYRSLANRVRCWAHLERKVKGLKESCDTKAAAFGAHAVDAFKRLREIIKRMRELRQEERKAEQATCHEIRLQLIYECVRYADAEHEETRSFAGEIINDQNVIFRQITEPELPFTNNLAEQRLRPIVIMRKISGGSKSADGSRATMLLMSLIGTLEARKQECWSFLTSLFAGQRLGLPPPALPPNLSTPQLA